MPTLIVWGDQDKTIPVDHAYETHEAISNSRLRSSRAWAIPARRRALRFVEILVDFDGTTEPSSYRPEMRRSVLLRGAEQLVARAEYPAGARRVSVWSPRHCWVIPPWRSEARISPMSSSGMIRLVSALVGLALLATIAAACGVGPKSDRDPSLDIDNHTALCRVENQWSDRRSLGGLQDAQQVIVSVKGFPRDPKYFLSECFSPTDVNAAGCGNQLAAQPFGMTDDLGSGSTTFSVQSSASTEPYVRTTQPYTGDCVIVATAGINGAFSFAPITFAPPAAAAPGTHPCTNGQIDVSDNGF